MPEKCIEIYWKDLTEEMQNRILAMWGENGNLDCFTLITLYKDPGDPRQ